VFAVGKPFELTSLYLHVHIRAKNILIVNSIFLLCGFVLKFY